MIWYKSILGMIQLSLFLQYDIYENLYLRWQYCGYLCMVNTMVIGHTMGKLGYTTTASIAAWSLHGHFSAKTITTTLQSFGISLYNFTSVHISSMI